MAGSDLRLYNKTGTYETIIVGEYPSELMSSSLLSEDAASDIEIIANKVSKFMLTAKGTFALDADYGARLTTYRQISTYALQRIYLEVAEDVRRCAEFIRLNEDGIPADHPRLASLKLERIHYDPVRTPQRLDVYIRISATNGETAVLDIRQE